MYIKNNFDVHQKKIRRTSKIILIYIKRKLDVRKKKIRYRSKGKLDIDLKDKVSVINEKKTVNKQLKYKEK